VLPGDDLVDSRDPLLATMIEVRRRTRGSVVALMAVPHELVHLDGCAAVEDTGDRVDHLEAVGKGR